MSVSLLVETGLVALIKLSLLMSLYEIKANEVSQDLTDLSTTLFS